MCLAWRLRVGLYQETLAFLASKIYHWSLCLSRVKCKKVFGQNKLYTWFPAILWAQHLWPSSTQYIMSTLAHTMIDIKLGQNSKASEFPNWPTCYFFLIIWLWLYYIVWLWRICKHCKIILFKVNCIYVNQHKYLFFCSYVAWVHFLIVWYWTQAFVLGHCFRVAVHLVGDRVWVRFKVRISIGVGLGLRLELVLG